MTANWSGVSVGIWVAIVSTIVFYELWSLLDGNLRTPPLTWITVRWVPWWITVPFLAWLLVHFVIRYAKPEYIRNLRGLS